MGIVVLLIFLVLLAALGVGLLLIRKVKIKADTFDDRDHATYMFIGGIISVVIVVLLGIIFICNCLKMID